MDTKYLLFGIVFIILASFVSGATLTDNPQTTTDTNINQAGYQYGFKIVADKDFTLTKVTKETTTTASNAYLYDDTFTFVVSAGFVGNGATFSQEIKTGETWYVVFGEDIGAIAYDFDYVLGNVNDVAGAGTLVHWTNARYRHSTLSWIVGTVSISNYIEITGVEPVYLFELQSKDYFTSENITTFSATITNSTTTQTISTTNGSVFWGFNQIVNITINSSAHFNKTYTNVNTSENLNATLYPTSLNGVARFYDLRTNESLNNANITLIYPSGNETNLTTNSSGHITFNHVINNSYEFGAYKITVNDYAGFITPITFTENLNNYSDLPLNKEYGISDANIVVNVYDRSTTTLLNGVNATISLLNFGSAITNNGTYNFNNITLVVGDIVVKVTADGYITEQQTVSYTGQENATVNIYLLNSTQSNAGFLFASVIDEFYRVQSNAIVELYEYNEDQVAYIKVSEVRSNINGESVFAIELNTKTYYLKATKEIDGQIYTVETTPEIIKTDEEVRNLVMRLTQVFDSFSTDYLDISISETFVNNISTIYVDFSTNDNFATEVCVEYFKVNNTIWDSVYSQCVATSSGYTATPVNLDRNFYYIAQVYQKTGSSKIVLKEYRYPNIASFSYLIEKNNYTNYIIIFLWVVLIALMFQTQNVMVLIVLGLILSWAELVWFPDVKNAIGSVFKTIILLFMFFTSRKKEDLN